jgi:hypothetical protein
VSRQFDDHNSSLASLKDVCIGFCFFLLSVCSVLARDGISLPIDITSTEFSPGTGSTGAPTACEPFDPFKQINDVCCTLHAARCTLHAARCTLHAARCTLHDLHTSLSARPPRLQYEDVSSQPKQPPACCLPACISHECNI